MENNLQELQVYKSLILNRFHPQENGSKKMIELSHIVQLP